MDARSPKVQIALGHLYLATGRIEYALEAFDRAVAFAPMLDTAHRGRGDALAESGRLHEARQAYVRAIELSPRNPLNHAHYGFALYQNGQYEAATGQFSEAARLDPDNPRYPSNLSAALAMLSRFEEAAEAALDSIEIRPSAPGFSNAGWHFYSAGRYDRAVEMFRKAVELTPADAKIQGNLADACRMHEACDDWRAHYEKALTLVDSRLGVNPGDVTALVYPATHCVTYRVRLNRQCKARPAVNGQPFTRDATPQCRFRRAPEGRAGEHSSAAFCLLERTLPFPARQALQLNALRLAISYTMSGGVH